MITSAPRHPGTPAPRHPGTPAPRHPGTPAPRRCARIADLPLIVGSVGIFIFSALEAKAALPPPTLTATSADNSFRFAILASPAPVAPSIGDYLLVGILGNDPTTNITVTLSLPPGAEFTQCTIDGTEVINGNKASLAIRPNFNATLGDSINVSGDYQIVDQPATKKAFTAIIHVAAFCLFINETKPDLLDDVVFIGANRAALHVNAGKVVGRSDVDIEARTDTPLPVTLTVSAIGNGTGTATLIDPNITIPVGGATANNPIIRRITGGNQSTTVGDCEVIGTENNTTATANVALTVSRGEENAPSVDYDGDGAAYPTDDNGKDHLSNGRPSFMSADASVPANQKANYGGTWYRLNSLGNFLTMTSYSTQVGTQTEQRHYFDADSVSYAALSPRQKRDLCYPDHNTTLRIVNITSNCFVACMQADTGPTNQTLIEMSECAADQLSIPYTKAGVIGTFLTQFRYP